MGLPQIYVLPQSDADWQGWAFQHAANHYDIVGALKQQFPTVASQLQQFPLDPMDFNNLGNWDYQHQIMHAQANAVLQFSGFDLLSLDWEDQDELASWFRLNGNEHQRISAALGIA